MKENTYLKYMTPKVKAIRQENKIFTPIRTQDYHNSHRPANNFTNVLKSAKDKHNFCISEFTSKRKFQDLEKEKEKSSQKTKEIIARIHSLFQDIDELDDNTFSHRFVNMLEDSMSLHKLVPVSLNQTGSLILEDSRFWILWFKYKFINFINSVGIPREVTIVEFLEIMDNCVQYEQSNLKMLNDFFIKVLNDKFSKTEIFIRLQANGSTDLLKIEDIDQLNENHYKYLLSKPEVFLGLEITKGSIKKQKFNSTNKKEKGISSLNNDEKVIDLTFELPKEESEACDKPIQLTNEEIDASKLEKSTLSTDAKILYNELIFRNKVDLVQERNSFAFGSINSKPNIFITIAKCEKFSITQDDIQAEKKKKVSYKPITEREELKTSEDLESDKEKNKRKSTKNAKKFESDMKGDDLTPNHRGRNKDRNTSNRLSVSAHSPKESEDEEDEKAKENKKDIKKRKTKSKPKRSKTTMENKSKAGRSKK